jgi:hypothetical protein
MRAVGRGRASRTLLFVSLLGLLSAVALLPARTFSGEAAAPTRPGSLNATALMDLAQARGLLAAQSTSALPDATLSVPWENVLWSTMPNFTWAACDLSAGTRKVVDLALGQWSYAAQNQGIPIHFTEVPCTNGSTQAQIAVFEASSAELAGAGVPLDVDVFGLTLTRDANGRICMVDVTGPCVAHASHIYLFTDNWQSDGLTSGQEAKTTAHEFGHAIGLAHARYCTYDSVMAQDCEPIFKGLGPDDVQSIDALVDYDLTYFGKPPLHQQAVIPPPTGAGATAKYKAGWNLVAGPRGTRFYGAAGTLYTYLPTSTSYEPFPIASSSYDGYGYWAYFPQDSTVQLAGAGNSFYSADGDPGQWFLIGNENGTMPMQVLGADAVETYDPQAGQYQQTNTLQPGQAAWVKVGKSGQIAVAATSLNRSQITCFLDLGNPATC